MVKFLKLVQVQTFFRHGARTPLHHVRSPAVQDAFWTPALTEDLEHTVYPFRLVEECSRNIIDFSTISSLPVPLKLPGGLYTGELIKHGQQEAFDLGKRLKCVYIDGNHFLSPNVNEEELYCRSTLIARTVKSLECVVAGLFSPRDASKVDALTIYVVPLDREYLFPNPAVCSIVDQLAKDGMAECLESRRHSELKRKLKKILGVKKLYDDFRPTPWDCPIYFVRDDYTSRRRAGYPLPPGLSDLFPLMDQLSTEELYWEYLGKQRMWGENIHHVFGHTLRMILCNMSNYSKIPKFHLYSCHDSTLMLLLYALGCFDGCWPPFAADLILELYIDEEARSTHDEDMSHSGPQNSYLHNHYLTPALDALWFRVLYLGKTVPLGCLWKIPYNNGDRYNAGFVPLHFLYDRWRPSAPALEEVEVA
ncbi:hypothetical protein P879_05978 [Paragonimus westermani]|uniref:Lysophosphatidic acid phosphatase type 6 n=1 Tax=Paragonimus westermani TaxID=34504 RepID=A0A8T0D1M8_9TREM|nr:hypothetical protein P879_05978 [Paragonimus westermani]